MFGAALVKGRMVFVPGRLWMLSCRSVIVLAGMVSPALLGVMLCGGLVVWPALRALMPMSVHVLGFLVAGCAALVVGMVRLLGAVGGVCWSWLACGVVVDSGVIVRSCSCASTTGSWLLDVV